MASEGLAEDWEWYSASTKRALRAFALKDGRANCRGRAPADVADALAPLCGNDVSANTTEFMRPIVTAVYGILLVGMSGSQSETQSFVIRALADTIAVEHLTRSASTLTGDLHLFSEQTDVHYVLHLRPDGLPETAEVVDERPNFFTGTIVFGTPSGGVGQTGMAGRLVRVPADVLPVIGTSMGLIDYVIRLHSPAVGERVQMKALNIRNGNSVTVTVKRFAPDSVLVDCDGCMRQRVTEELRVGLSAKGGIDGAVRVEQHWTVAHQ